VPGLTDVAVSLVPTGDTSSDDGITLVDGRVTGRQGRLAQGVRTDVVSVPGSLRTYSAVPGDADTSFTQALQRAGLILDELERLVRDFKPSIGLQTLDALVTDNGLVAMIGENGGWHAQVTFTVEFTVLVT